MSNVPASCTVVSECCRKDCRTNCKQQEIKRMVRRCSHFVCVFVPTLAIFAIYVIDSATSHTCDGPCYRPPSHARQCFRHSHCGSYVRTYSVSPFWSSFYEARNRIPFITLSGKNVVISARRCVAVRRFGLRAREPVRIYSYRDWRSESECECE